MIEEWVRIARIDELPDGEVRVFELEGEGIALCNAGGEVFAIEDICTHDDGPLGEGHLEGHCIECPRHGARFDIRTGAAVRMPAVAPVGTYPVKTENGEVFVQARRERGR